jgi:hypothetical protein
MGGIAGGLFSVFEGIGFVFFLILIGFRRADRPELRNHRVWVGGVILGAAAGFAFPWLAAWTMHQKVVFEKSITLSSVGACVCLCLALVLIAYVSHIEAEERREEREKRHREARIAKGLDPDGGCFIATAVFGSTESPEVLKLRAWRNETLLDSPVGRDLVRIYYLVSPRFARTIRRHAGIRTCVRVVLRSFIRTIRVR